MDQRKPLLLGIALSLLAVAFFNGFFYEVQDAPIGIFYSTSEEGSVNGSQRYPLERIEIAFPEPFASSSVELHAWARNFTSAADFWDRIHGALYLNERRIEEYKHANNPEFLLTSQFVSGNLLPIWLDISYSYAIKEASRPFFTRAGFARWEARYFIDS